MVSRKIRFPKFLDKAVTLSYDDGVKQDIRLIELLKKHGMKGTFNLGSGMCEATKNHLKKSELYDTYAKEGVEVAVHGRGHLYLTAVDKVDVVAEFLDDRRELEKIFKTVINGMAYPYGVYDEQTLNIIDNCGIKYARTTKSTNGFNLPKNWLEWHPTAKHTAPELNELVDKFFALADGNYWRQSLRVFYLWGHSYEFDNDNNWNVIEEFCERVGNRDDVWYATNGEIYEYIKASERLQFTADGCYVYNPSAIPVYLEDFGKRVIAEPNATVKIR
jgi:peptidoglycan/xylan/chitin deacetylase (PgdA/CDA1 family)